MNYRDILNGTLARNKLQRRLWFPLITLLATACGSSEASSLDAQASERAPSSEGRARGQLRAVAEHADKQSSNCAAEDQMLLTILDGRRRVSSHSFCSAYGRANARLVTDARNRSYVLLEHYEGHGTRATSGYLTIYEFDVILRERARLLVTEPVGFFATANYQYEVVIPLGGGITLNGRWSLEGELRADEEAPARAETVLAIDTASAATR